jgi:hypothetical protein
VKRLLAILVFALGLQTQPVLACAHDSAPPPGPHAEHMDGMHSGAHGNGGAAHGCCDPTAGEVPHDCPDNPDCNQGQAPGWVLARAPRISLPVAAGQLPAMSVDHIPQVNFSPPFRPPSA